MHGVEIALKYGASAVVHRVDTARWCDGQAYVGADGQVHSRATVKHLAHCPRTVQLVDGVMDFRD